MKLVPVERLSDQQWQAAWDMMYDLKLTRHIGTENPQPKPPLQVFYNEMMDAVERGTLKAWGVVGEDGTYHGHTVLEKSTGEWEMGTVLGNEELWGSGIGFRAAMYALRWAFDHGAQWALAFVRSRDPRVAEMVEKVGFKKFMHFYVLSRETWDERWASKVDRILRDLDAQEN